MAWTGIVTFTCLLLTVLIVILNKKGIHTIPITWHFIFGWICIILAAFHAFLGLSVYL